MLEKYGVGVKQFIDYKALLGDTSDNVPGVKGIGEKTAVTLLNTYNDLDNIYAHLDEVKPARAKTALEAGKDSAYLSRTLVTIKTDLPMEVDWEACRAEVDYSRTLGLFRDLRFESLIKRIPAAAPAEAEEIKGKAGGEASPQLGLFGTETASSPSSLPLPPAPDVPTQLHLVDSDAKYKELLAVLREASLIAWDTETTSVDPMVGEMVGMSFSTQAGEGWYLPTQTAEAAKAAQAAQLAKTVETDAEPSTEEPAPPAWQLDPTSPKFEPIMKAMQRKGVKLVAHNAKYDLGVLKALGYEIDEPVLDTMLAQFLVDPGSPSLGLKALAFNHLGWQMTEITSLIGRGKKQVTMREVPVALAAPYAAADADATFQLWKLLEPQLRAKNQEALFYDVELPLICVLLDMEFDGVALDVKYLSDLSTHITDRLRELEKTIYNEAGLVFNINSPQTVGRPVVWQAAVADGSRIEDAERRIQHRHRRARRAERQAPDHSLHHRAPRVVEIKGTYVDALPLLINPKTGRLHTDFNQAGAVTGRVSSSNPNLQNIPIKTEIGRRVRKAFTARKGWRLISADYSQVELRILAHMADDDMLRGAFERGEDIHASTAAAIYDVPLTDVSSMQRNFAKRINFGIAYGMGAFALAANTGMSMSDASEFITKYFARFPKVKAWLDNTKKIAAEQGYVETMLGRRRYFPELRTGSGAPEMQKRRAEREAINHPVQGSAADIMKIAMIHIHKALKDGKYEARMTLQVHDELVFDCPTNELDAVSALVKREMEAAYTMSVPLRADVNSGKNWDDA